MKKLSLLAVVTLFVLSAFSAWAEVPPNAIPPVFAAGWTAPVKKNMRAFQSDQELAAYLRQVAEKHRRELQASLNSEMNAPAPARTASVAGMADAKSDGPAESITNVQHAGVDEGGIVKLHGDHLVVLRRGRLFTVAIGGDALKPISAVDAFGPDIDPRNTWYDEMLVSENTIAVIGYSYERGGTEVGLFNIDSNGNLSYRSTYHLRSNDYYSSRNYASRLIGNKLIFYSPLYLNSDAQNPFQNFPAMRKWHKGANASEFQRIVSATHIYRPERNLELDYGTALHTVTVCDLSGGDFKCEATSVLGPPGRVFYVSPDAVYVWVNDWVRHGNETRTQSMVYRMPLDGSSPSALGVSGAPIDQFSFLQSEDGNLNVLVRADSVGDGMWGAEMAAGDVALMRIPLGSFSDGSQDVSVYNYRKLPKPSGYTFQNRFVGDYLLYGTGSGWGYPQEIGRTKLIAVRWTGGEVHQILLPHGVDRIEQLGNDAVVIGTDGKDLHFSAIRLGEWPEVADRYMRKGASQGELRSQGFFYKPDGADTGTLGLPISVPARSGYQHLFDSSAAILFLRNDSLHFEEVGELTARSDKAVDDACRASCVDWYGNSRPLFVHGRVLALMGYEIVEGTIGEGRMREVRRVNYSPLQAVVTRSGE
ncbi:MAG TPA: beta-propeller domain-containing protein [Pyrinomonadaceae bacterium]|nr:beta-propeller domain-containing protein [Pyrinomonadaceae bacterium]